MPLDREQIENVLIDVRADRDDAEARAVQAANSLVRLGSGITPLAEIDPDQVEAAADDFSSALRKMKLLEQFARKMRKLLS